MPRLPQLTARELVRFLKSLSIAAANFTNRFNEALGTELEVVLRHKVVGGPADGSRG